MLHVHPLVVAIVATAALTVAQSSPVAGKAASAGVTNTAHQGPGTGPLAGGAIVPAVAATTFGNTSNAYPFSSYPMRYQQVFDGSELPTTHLMVGLGLRQDQSASYAGREGATVDVAIKLGYTTKDRSTLTTTYDANFDSGTPLQVLPRTKFKLVDFQNPAPTDPGLFLIQMPFKVPFNWVQQSGRNLLIEIVIYGNDKYAAFSYNLDASSGTTSTTSRLYSLGFPTAPTGTLGLNYGLVMCFTDKIKVTSDYSYYGMGCQGTGGFSGDILPASGRTAMGNSNNAFPFAASNQRYQQVHLGTELPTPAVYNALHLRNKAATTGGARTVQIDIGYTTYDHTTITGTFATNIDSGPLTTVFNGNWNFPALAANTDPQNLNGAVIPFTSPWAYVPGATKNLLLDIRQLSTATVSGQLDAFSGTAVTPNATRIYATGATTATTGSIGRNYAICIGLGKAGNGNATPLLNASGSPKIGGSVDVLLSNARANTPAFCTIGLSDKLWIALPLPFDMSALGAKGCSLYASLDVMVGGLTDAVGGLKTTIPVPNDTALIKGMFYNQYLVYDPPANAFQLVTTNGGAATIGEQ